MQKLHSNNKQKVRAVKGIDSGILKMGGRLSIATLLAVKLGV